MSVGQLGAWGVNKHDYIYFRYGVSKRRPQGENFLQIILLYISNPSGSYNLLTKTDVAQSVTLMKECFATFVD